MPQYFNNAYQSTAFSEGLMAGFNFVDSIRQRRRQLELEERQQNRLDRQMTLAEEAASRAAESHGLQMDTGRFALERAQTEAAWEDADRDFTLSERERALRQRSENESALREIAGGMISGRRSGASALADIGRQGAAPRTASPVASAAPRTASPVASTAPTQAPQAPQAAAPAAEPAEPAPPVDLRRVQAERDAEPNLFQRAVNFVISKRDEVRAANEAQDIKIFWSAVADPGSKTGYHRDIGKGVDLADIRRDPAPHAFVYLKDRDRVPAEVRGTLDHTMSAALKDRAAQLTDQIKALDPRDQRNAGRIKNLTDQLIEANRNLDELSKAMIKTAAKDAGITRPVKKEDPRATEAIVAAAAKARQAQPIQEVTPDELRAAQQVWSRTANSPRLNEKQIAAGTTLLVNGLWSAEDFDNYLKYGTPVAPQRPTPLALGGGSALLITDEGYTIINAGGSEGADGYGGLSASQVRLRQRDNLERIQKNFQDMMAAGVLPKKRTIIGRGNPATVGEYERMFHDFVKRLGPQIQMQSGIPVIGPNGELTYALMDPAELDALQNSFVEYFKNERADLFGPDALLHQGRDPASYLPTSPGSEIIDLMNEEF